MDLQKLLSINMATLAALGTLLLAMGQRSLLTALVVWIAAIAAVIVTDFKGWFRVTRNMAAGAGFVIIVCFLPSLIRFDGEARLLVLANLLVYLQVVLLFQEKEERVFWWLAVLSLLQAVVAAPFSQGVGFGVLLVVYMLVGLCGMTLLFLYAQANRRTMLGAGLSTPPEAETTLGRRWPLAAEKPSFTSSPVGNNRAGIVRELFARLALLAVGTLILTVVIFFSAPRLGRPAWRGATMSAPQLVGFSDEVRLGALGEVLESRDEVMRLQLFDRATGRQHSVQDDLYLRGAVVTHYAKNRWSVRRGAPDPANVAQGDRRSRPGARSGDRAPTPSGDRAPTPSGDRAPTPSGDRAPTPSGDRAPTPSGDRAPTPSGDRAPTRDHVSTPGTDALVIQRAIVEPLDRDELFCLWPFVPPPDNDKKLVFDRANDRLLRRSNLRGQRFKFDLETMALAGGVQSSLVPADGPVETEPLMQMPKLPRLTALANQWIAASGLPADDWLGRARLLERQFAESGRFQYSLKGQSRDLSVDAIEDFVSDHPRGHCEYFATALALMLRSQGIPSRVVLGYRCDEWNEVGKFYQVRQLHAHAWVEAYVPPEHIRDSLFRDDPWRWVDGGWLRLDATPAAALGTQAAGESTWNRLQHRFGWLQTWWDTYVVEMDRQRQREAIYQPMVRAIQHGLQNLRDPGWWRGVWEKLLATVRLAAWDSIVGWLLGVVLPLILGLFLLTAAIWGITRLVRRAVRWLAARGRAPAARRSTVEFYRRFEHLLARRGLVRARGQTPREFACAAGLHLARESGRGELEAMPLTVVEAFYHVRFGRRPLDNLQVEAVEHALAELSGTRD